METKLIDTLLRVGRTRAASSDARESKAGVNNAALPGPVRRREAQFSDFSAVAALKIRSGLSRDSIENWTRLWRQNPALAHAKTQLPIGWVQETERKIVGYMGSIPLLYQFGDETLLAAATTCYAVDPAYRPSSLGIVGTFFQQPGYDLYLDTTATEAAGKIMQAFRAVRLPQKDYETVLFWVLQPHRFLRAVMRKLELADTLAAAGAWLGSPVLSADILFRNRRPRPSRLPFVCRRLQVEEIGDDFQDLWLRKLKERPRLLACRTPEALRWHFLVPHSNRKATVLAGYQGNRLAGYAVVLSGNPDRLGLRKSTIADLLVAGDEPEVVSELLVEAYEIAKENHSDVLELLGFPEEIRRICQNWKPYRRKYPACPFFYRATWTELGERLSKEDSWYACPFDGDTTLGLQ